jgi:UDP-glucose 4-epimerase
MKYLITGGAGFIGSNLVDNLISKNNEVIVIDNESSGEYPFWNNNAKNYKKDISDYNSTRMLYEDVDFVIHLAATTRIQKSIALPLETITNNVVGTSVALQCAKEAGVKRFIYASTSSIYGNNNTPNIESQENDCFNPYSISKSMGEELCKMYSKIFNLDTIILRYFNVYGNRQPSSDQNGLLISRFKKQKENNKSLTIYGSGEQKKDYTHVDDVVNATLQSCIKEIKKENFGEVFNVGSGKNYTVNEIASVFKTNISYLPERKYEVNKSLADIDKIKNVFDWEPKIDLMDWLIKNV